MSTIYQLSGDRDGTRFYTHKRPAVADAKHAARDPESEVEITVEKCTLVKCRPSELAVRCLTGAWCEKSEVVYRKRRREP